MEWTIQANWAEKFYFKILNTAWNDAKIWKADWEQYMKLQSSVALCCSAASKSQLLGDEQNQWSLTNENEFKHQFQGETQRKPDRLLHSSCSPATTLLLNIKTPVHAEKTKPLCSVVVGARTQDTKCFFVGSWLSQKGWTSILMHGTVTRQCPGGAGGSWYFASYHEFGKHKLLQEKPKSIKKNESHMADFH